MQSPRLACIFGLSLALCGFAAPAAPPETSTIKELSRAQAKRLVKDSAGGLSLDSVTSLAAETAGELARYEGWLSLNGLTSLSDETAAALGGHKGFLVLDGLTSLSETAAASLAKHGGFLSLNGITTLSDEAARPLLTTGGADGVGKSPGGLSLRGLTTLSPEAAKALAARKRSGVVISGLTALTPEVATILAGVPPAIWNGDLFKLKTVSDEVAVTLGKRPGRLSLPALRDCSPAAVTALAGKVDGMLPAVRSLNAEAAALLVKSGQRPINLDGLEELSEDVVRILVTNKGELRLNGLKTLSAAVAGELSKHNTDVWLNGLGEISAEVAGKLASGPGDKPTRPRVHLDGLTKVSDETVEILAAWPKWAGRLPRLQGLSEKAAAALAKSRTWDGRLPALTSLSAAAARLLAARDGNLELDGLGDLHDDVATALAGHRGGTLSLDGLKTISDAAAAALAAQRGGLSLKGLTSLSDAAARSLANHKGGTFTMTLTVDEQERAVEFPKEGWLWLDGLTTVSPAAARAFAAAAGTVSLGGLKPAADETNAILRSSLRIRLPDAVRRVAAAGTAVAAADEKFVHAFLGRHCGECHGEDAEKLEGEFAIDNPWPSMGGIAGRVAYASIVERLRSDDMPPPQVKQRPDPGESARVIGWILGQLDTPLPGPAVPYAVKDRPVDGNRLPHAILFGGPRGPSVPPPSRLWRLSPDAYRNWVNNFKGSQVNQQPFGLIMEPGFKDFAALYSPDEGASGLLLTNAELLVDTQSKPYVLVNTKEKPPAGKQVLWPGDDRLKACSPAEKKLLEDGLRVTSAGPFTAIMHPHVAATRAELEAAISQQFRTAIARGPVPAEVESLVKLYETVAREGDHRLAGRTILMAPLMSPEAVLRFEIGTGVEVRPGVRMLAPREVAQAVSLTLGNTMIPSLFQAADGGGLRTRDDVAVHVRRLLDGQGTTEPRVLRFFREYFGYDRAPDVFKDPLPVHFASRGMGFKPGVMVLDCDARVFAALSADKQVLKTLLAGEDVVSHGGETQAQALRMAMEEPFRAIPPQAIRVRKGPVEDRVGLLMSPAWLVAWSTNFHNDPVRRGRWIREQLLGGRVPDLPINAAAMIPEDHQRTLRERQAVTRDAKCWKCHHRMDDLGLPFEAFTHYGHAQDGEEVVVSGAAGGSGDKKKEVKIFRSAPLDTTGVIAHSGDPGLDGPVSDAPEMLRRLAASDRVRQVFVRHAFRFFMGRNETPGDAPSLQEADRAYVESDGSFKELIVSLLSSEAFLYRTIAPPETKTAAR
jgi:hypothetical protein